MAQEVTSAQFLDLASEVRRHRLRWRVSTIILLSFVVAGWSSSASQQQTPVLHVRGLIVEDSLGRARVVIGAPLALPGRSPEQAGTGIAILSEDGRFRTGIGAPMPAPEVDGTVSSRIANSAGLVIADEAGNERGGVGIFPDGRANVCLDYARGVKEAACLSVFPGDRLAGLIVNGTPDQRAFDRLTALVGADGLAMMKIANTSGRESAILRSVGMGPAELVVYDSASPKFRNVMPKP